MMDRPIVALALAIAAAPQPATSAATDPAEVRIAAPPPRPGWFVCDAIEGPFAALFGARDAHGGSIVTLIDRDAGRTTTSRVQVAAGDPGAGQIHYALSRGGRPVGDVHMVNPGMVGDPVLPAVTGVDLDGRHLECRFMPDMRFLGITATRSVMVRGQGAGLVYESFDYRRRGRPVHPDGVHRSNAPSLAIPAGSEAEGAFRFANSGVDYVVSPGTGRDAGRVVARQAGRIVATDRFLGSEVAPDRAMATLGAGAVWPAGASFAGCRGARSGVALRGCLIGAMEAGGATPAAVSFANLLADRGDFGFMTEWQQAGPVGIATIAYPWRANSNEGQAIMTPAAAPIFVDDYRPSAADRARADWRSFIAAHRDAFPVTPAEVSIAKTAPGVPVTIRARYRLATCRACAALGEMTVAWRFAANGRPLGAGVERVSS